jgi:hypothetical protein
MRKLVLSAAIVLLSSSAFAQGPRGLSSPQPAVVQPAIVQAAEQRPARRPEITVLPAPVDQPAVTGVVQAAEQRPARRPEITVLPAPADQPAVTSAPSLEDKLKAAGELKPDGTPANDAPPPAPVQAQAPVQPQPAPAPVRATAPEAAKPVAQAHSTHKTARKRVAHRGESDERKARRIAARFGIYW